MSREIVQNLRISEPCAETWSEMGRAGSSRYCAACNRKVHDLCALTTDQIEAVLVETGGEMCARLTTGPRGEILTADSEYRSFLTPLLLASCTLLPGTIHAQINKITQTVKLPDDQAHSTPTAFTTISGTVTDAQGASVVGADVLLLAAVDESSEAAPLAIERTDDRGAFRFEVSAGDYTLRVNASGFESQTKRVSLTSPSTDHSAFSLVPAPVLTQITVSVVSIDSTTVGELVSSAGPWYKRLAMRARHPIAYSRFLARRLKH